MVESASIALDPRLRSWRHRVFASTWLCYAGMYFCRKPFYIAKSDLGAELGWSASDLALPGMTYLLAYTLGQFVAGWAGTRQGPRLLLLFGLGTTALTNLAFGFSNSLVAFASLMSLNGLAQSTGWSNTVGCMANWFRRGERGRVMGVWATCYQFGGVMANTMAAWILGAYGFRYSFFAGSAVVLCVLAFFALNQRDRPEDVGLSLPDEDQGSGSLTQPGDPVSASQGAEKICSLSALGWDRPIIVTVLLVGLFYFFVKFIRYALWSWVPFILSRNFGLEGDAAGYTSTLFDLFGIAGVIAAGWASDTWAGGRRTGISIILLGGMVVACGLLATIGLESVFLFGICLAVVGFTLYGPDALMTGAGAQDIGSAKGATLAAGIINGMGSIGAVVQEFVIGGIYDQSGGGLGLIFGLLLGASAAAALCLCVVRLARLSEV